MSEEGQYAEAVAKCEAAARRNGHVLGKWLPVDARLHAALCEVCGAMAWVTLPGSEKRWRPGGTALEQGCLGGENLNSDLGA